MVRLQGVDPKNPPDLVKKVFERAREAYGQVITPTLILAHRPEILLALARLGQAIGASSVVEPRLKTMVSLRAAQMIGCPF